MRKLTLTLSAAALALTGAGVALADDHRGGERNTDTNGDGVVSLAEAKAQGAKHFARMDANGDGQISREDRAARQAMRFESSDTDGDGEVSQAEMKAAADARFAQRMERMEQRRDRREGRAEQRFERLDADGSGGISEAEMAEARGVMGERMRSRAHNRPRQGMHGQRHGEGRAAMRMLRQADTNKDQAVSRTEFDAAIEARFARVDADGSGTITSEERKAAREAMRARMQERRQMRLRSAN